MIHPFGCLNLHVSMHSHSYCDSLDLINYLIVLYFPSFESIFVSRDREVPNFKQSYNDSIALLIFQKEAADISCHLEDYFLVRTAI